jgi:hypothetical protein
VDGLELIVVEQVGADGRSRKSSTCIGIDTFEPVLYMYNQSLDVFDWRTRRVPLILPEACFYRVLICTSAAIALHVTKPCLGVGGDSGTGSGGVARGVCGDTSLSTLWP